MHTVTAPHRRHRLGEFNASEPLIGDIVAAIIAGEFAFDEVEDLGALADRLRSAFAEAQEGATTDADVEQLGLITAAFTKVNETIEANAAAAATRAQEIAAMAATFGTTTDEDGTEDAGDADGEDDTEDGDNADTDEDGTEDGDNADASNAVTPDVVMSLNALGKTRKRKAPAPARRADVFAFTPSAALTAQTGLAEIDRKTMGEAFSKFAKRLATPAPTAQRHALASLNIATGGKARLIDGDAVMKANAGDAESVFAAAVEHFEALRADALREKRFTASGGLCVAPTTDYGLEVVGGYPTPVFLDSLPGFTSSRPTQFYPWIELDLFDPTMRESLFDTETDLFDAVNFVTAAQDAAGYVSQGGTTPDKACVQIPCYDPVTCDLEAVYWCLTFGNFLSRAWPEYVRAIENIVLAGLAYKRDARAQAKVISVAKKVKAEAMYGAGVDVDTVIARLIASIRSRTGDDNLSIEVYFPGWVKDAAAEDKYRSLMNSQTLHQLRSQSIEGWAARGVHIHEYKAPFGTTEDGSPTYLDAQGEGDLIEWPTQVRIVAFPTGGVVHQSAWELSVGLTETLVGTNDVGTFAEIAENVCIRTSHIYAVDIGICTGGVRGGSVVADCGIGAVPPEDDENPVVPPIEGED